MPDFDVIACGINTEDNLVALPEVGLRNEKHVVRRTGGARIRLAHQLADACVGARRRPWAALGAASRRDRADLPLGAQGLS